MAFLLWGTAVDHSDLRRLLDGTARPEAAWNQLANLTGNPAFSSQRSRGKALRSAWAAGTPSGRAQRREDFIRQALEVFVESIGTQGLEEFEGICAGTIVPPHRQPPAAWWKVVARDSSAARSPGQLYAPGKLLRAFLDGQMAAPIRQTQRQPARKVPGDARESKPAGAASSKRPAKEANGPPKPEASAHNGGVTPLLAEFDPANGEHEVSAKSGGGRFISDRVGTPMSPRLSPTLLHAPGYGIERGNYMDRLRELVRRPEHLELFAVSYVTELKALEECGLLDGRARTRILVRPPNGLSREDAEKLAARQTPGLEVRQLRAGADTALAHLKVVHMRSDTGRVAVVGSSNLTKKGMTENVEVNVLVDSTLVGFEDLETTLERLWSDKMSQELDPGAFVIELKTDRDGAPLHLLDFQAEKLRELKEYYRQNKKGGALLSLPTGTGKTVIAARFLLDEVLRHANSKVLWLAPQEELLAQAAATFSEQRLFARFPQLRIEPPEPRSRKELESDYNVIFRTVHTAAKRPDGARFDVVVVDEAHWGASESRSLVPTLQDSFRRTFWLGLTATPYRPDATDLGLLKSIFPRRIASPAEIENATDAAGRRVRAEVDPQSVETGFNIAFDLKKLVAHELGQKQLREFNKDTRNRAIAKSWNKKHGRTLVFAINIDHANRLWKAFKAEHPAARVQVAHTGKMKEKLDLPVPSIDGRFGEQERREIYRHFRRGDIDVLIGVNLYTMGIDFPAVETLFMSRPTLSPVLYAQMLGRGRRGPAFGGTEKVRVVDFADQVDTHRQLGERLVELMNFERERDYDERVTAPEEEWEAIRRMCRTWKNPLTKVRYDGPALYRILTPRGHDVREKLRRVRNLQSALENYVKGNAARRKHAVEYFVATPSASLDEVESLVRRFVPDRQYTG